ncbi:STM4012 family radical SAM protein [Inediibacterium massiliense]|uniref:STM4012 family radical SAM protein n=1 Tax=Inediibacterium massiliense TaxID=1658111 RepID=UPI0006B4F8F5|nr:STM4012 family radical SAM protein [Inediibacterium massiliense]
MNNIYKQYMYSYPHKTAYEYIKKLNLSEYNFNLKNQNIGLYYHIPFCDSKCGYCNLFSIPSKNEDRIEQYIEAILRHSQQLKQTLDLSEIHFDSLVFGGGTPLILSIKQLDKLFELGVKSYGIKLKEDFIGIETSPNQTTTEKLSYLKQMEMNRISIGVQSFVQKELDILERHHSAVMAEKALNFIKNEKFPILNIDLIYGIPGQTIKTLLYSAEKALQYKPEEIFVYPLYQQTNTRIYGKFHIDRRLQYELYQEITLYLKANGYHQISMRRFVKQKPDHEKSCGFENMIALGCGGRTYLDHLHYCEPYTAESKACIKSLDNYIKKEDFFENLSIYELSKEERQRRYVIKNLLHYRGIHKSEYEELFGTHLIKDYPMILEFCKKGWIIQDKDCIHLTQDGMGLSDYIGPMFMSSEVMEKMETYYHDRKCKTSIL